MSLLEAIVLGVVQGITEFLPISSTGHLRIVPALVGWEDPGAAFTAVIQLGTTAAVLIYFRDDLWRITRAWLASLRDPSRRRELDAKLGWYILLGTIPIGIFGFVFKDTIETGARSLYLIGSALIVIGLVMLVAEKVATQGREVEQLGPRDAVAIGFAQAVALIPGVSRSGATITAGLFTGLKREAAARYSFLLSTPAIVLSAAFEMRLFINGEEGGDTGALAIVVATVLAFVSGYASIAFLLRFVARHSLSAFVAYRVALGILVLALAGSGAIS